MSTKPALGFTDSLACLVGSTKQRYGLQIIHAMNFNAIEYGATATVSRPLTVAGFPAVVMEGKFKNDCYVAVDVADKQMFYVQWTDDGPGEPSMADVCAGVTKAATAAVQALVSS